MKVGNLRGFTLVELLVVMSILSVLSLGAVMTINPTNQVDKANDAKKSTDVGKIKIALENYFNDHGCYPDEIPFGEPFVDGQAVYMEHTPQDPGYPNESYFYYTEDSDCPHWYIVFNHLRAHNSSENACSLPAGCLPVNYKPEWKCTVPEGRYECSTIASKTLPEIISQRSTATPSQPTPTTVSYPHDIEGADGTWCYDSDKGSYLVENAFCVANNETKTDYCDGNMAKENYCTGTWDGKNWTDVHCATGGYVCPGGEKCSNGACVSL